MMAVAAIVIALLATTVLNAEVTLADDVNSVESIQDGINGVIEPLVNDTNAVADRGSAQNETLRERPEMDIENETISTSLNNRRRNGDAAKDSAKSSLENHDFYDDQNVNGSVPTNQTSSLPDTIGLNATSDNVTIDDTIETGGNASDSNDTVSTSPTTPLVTTPPPAVFVDPREFETDDKDLECPFPRRSFIPETTSISVSTPSTTLRCADLPFACFNCTYDYACTYGVKTTVSCTTDVDCVGDNTLERDMTCQYCFQTKFGDEHVCTLRNGPGAGGCHVKKSPSSKSRFRSNCTVKPHVLCLGRRTFHKMLPCNWTSGYRWTTSLILSIFLGGFGADRFYLGQWRQGIGKLFSFGGLGVWTVIDVILIAIGYIGPWDESLYIY